MMSDINYALFFHVRQQMLRRKQQQYANITLVLYLVHLVSWFEWRQPFTVEIQWRRKLWSSFWFCNEACIWGAFSEKTGLIPTSFW